MGLNRGQIEAMAPDQGALKAASRLLAAPGVPVFACTPDWFPDLMAAALRRQDLHAWAAKEDIKLVRAE
jgi:hypothetical protein